MNFVTNVYATSNARVANIPREFKAPTDAHIDTTVPFSSNTFSVKDSISLCFLSCHVSAPANNSTVSAEMSISETVQSGIILSPPAVLIGLLSMPISHRIHYVNIDLFHLFSSCYVVLVVQ